MTDVSAQARPGISDSSPEAFAWALSTVGRAYESVIREALESFDEGSRGYQVLATVGRELPKSQAALAAHLGMDRTMMTYLIDRLEAADLVSRAPDPTDRRARIITLTGDGRKNLAKLDQRLRAAEGEFLGRLGEADAAAARTLVIRLANETTDPAQAAAVCASLL